MKLTVVCNHFFQLIRFVLWPYRAPSLETIKREKDSLAISIVENFILIHLHRKNGFAKIFKISKNLARYGFENNFVELSK